jgi:hypothetical protein
MSPYRDSAKDEPFIISAGDDPAFNVSAETTVTVHPYRDAAGKGERVVVLSAEAIVTGEFLCGSDIVINGVKLAKGTMIARGSTFPPRPEPTVEEILLECPRE